MLEIEILQIKCLRMKSILGLKEFYMHNLWYFTTFLLSKLDAKIQIFNFNHVIGRFEKKFIFKSTNHMLEIQRFDQLDQALMYYLLFVVKLDAQSLHCSL